MAGIMKSMTCMVLIATLLIAAVAPPAEAAINCGTVNSLLSACIPYVINRGPLSGACCGGVRGLNNQARSPQDRQAVCNCLKSRVGSIPGVNYSKVAALPGQCGVRISYRISPSTDCSRVQ